MKTIFIDFDGCILHHDTDNYLNVHSMNRLDAEWLLPGVKEKLLDWFCKGYRIIITTGRPECQRQMMTEFLAKVGIYHNQLVLDCGAGVRYLINDIDPLTPKTKKAVAVNLKRNEGISKLKLE
jgi:hydroxymethylpyrimidine pyrophosphatase-like HAD family hydrolase